MRNLAWIGALLINIAGGSIFALGVFASGAPLRARVFGAVFAVAFLAIAALLLVVRRTRIQAWRTRLMQVLCIGVPVVWLLGALDLGTVSGQELASFLVVAVACWCTWQAFKLNAAQP